MLLRSVWVTFYHNTLSSRKKKDNHCNNNHYRKYIVIETNNYIHIHSYSNPAD